MHSAEACRKVLQVGVKTGAVCIGHPWAQREKEWRTHEKRVTKQRTITEGSKARMCAVLAANVPLCWWLYNKTQEGTGTTGAQTDNQEWGEKQR
jgi:hypothetical protein